MPRRTIGPRVGLLLCALLLGVGGAPARADFPAGAGAPAAQYNGFSIDDTRVRNRPDIETMRAAIRRQIDIVCAVGLPADALVFFRRVPVVILPAPFRRVGAYSVDDQRVLITGNIASAGNKPVLLHELLCAYDDQRLPAGIANPDIVGYYEQARQIPAFAATSLMMGNEMEYFACTATTYLFGSTGQEPFSRAKLERAQPDVVEFLRRTFGPGAGGYSGSPN